MAVGDLVSLPASLVNAMQEGFLERKFHNGLTSVMAYTSVATKEVIEARRGATITMTRKSEKAAFSTPADPSVINTGLDNGINPSGFSIEQFTLTMSNYLDGGDVNLVQDQAIIASEALAQAQNNGRQAQRVREAVAKSRLFSAYMGGNTLILGYSTGVLHVDDIRGFQKVFSNGDYVAVSSGTPLPVTETKIGSGGVTQIFNVTGWTADGSNVSMNAAAGGISGTLNITGEGSNPITGDVLTAQNAPEVFRPNGRLHTSFLQAGDLFSTSIALDVAAYLRDNGIPEFEDGLYRCILDNTTMRALFADSDFKESYRGRYDSKEYVSGRVVEHLGILYVPTTEAYVQQSANGVPRVRRPIIVGKDCLIQGDFAGLENWAAEQGAYGGIHEVVMVDGVAHIVRPPLDRLGQTVSLAWTSIFDYCVPSDVTATNQIIPTATTCAFKRAAVIECAG